MAEVEFDHDPVKTNPVRSAESLMVLAADNCGPGAYNLPMFLGFADPMYCAGLMLPWLVRCGNVALARIHRWTRMEGVRTAEGG